MGVGIQRRRRHHVSCWLARPVADSRAHASSYSYPDERRTNCQDGRSEPSASTHSSVHSERLALCEGDGHEHRQRSTATQSVRCPTKLPCRPSSNEARRSGTLQRNVLRITDRFDSDVRPRAKLSSPPVETALAVETLHLHLQSAFTRLRLVGCQTQSDNVVEAGSPSPALSERDQGGGVHEEQEFI